MKCAATFCEPDAQGLRLYRFTLVRIWDSSRPLLAWVMLNPSTADEFTNDQTISKCIAFARAWGYGGIIVVNLFAARSTDASVLPALYDEPNIERDTIELAEIVKATQGVRIIAAWGNGGHLFGKWGGGELRPRSAWALEALAGRRIECLNITSLGEPGHPLYVPLKTVPQIFRDGEAVPLPEPLQTTANLFE